MDLRLTCFVLRSKTTARLLWLPSSKGFFFNLSLLELKKKQSAVGNVYLEIADFLSSGGPKLDLS